MGQCHIAYCLFVYCNILLYCNMGHLEQKSSEMAVTIHWTGLLDWNTGLDYWTEIFSFFGQVFMF